MAARFDKALGVVRGSRRRRRAAHAAVVTLLVLAALFVVAGSASAANVNGTLKAGKGYRVVLVQANGLAKKATITKSSGAFTLRGATLRGATLHLVTADGSYFGPVVLKASRTKDYCTVKGSTALRLGTVTLKAGYALAGMAPRGRYDTRPPYTVTARSGKPLGAGKLGRVTTGAPAGYRGPGGDLDRDGVVGAFDIDDNGNLILDNVDRTGRGSDRPAARSGAVASTGRSVAALAPGPPPPPPDPEFRIFSNFKLGNDVRINVDIPGISDIDGLIARNLPTTVVLATSVLGGEAAKLDGLGNSYILEHSVDGVVYPRIELAWPDWSAATHTGSLLDLVAGVNRHGDALLMPGALPGEIGSGDAFVETAPDGVTYPGVLNFVFNTAPALKSYQFDTDGTPTEMVYGADGVPANRSRITVPSGAKSVTLTWWRPQRKAAAGEIGEWIDMGGLAYAADIFGPAKVSDAAGAAAQPGTHSANGAYLNAVANGNTIPTDGTEERIVDSAADAPANGANTMSFTLSFEKCYSDWSSFGPGTLAEFDIAGSTVYGDNAACRVQFVLE
jgi:hypothetical protein